MSAGEREVGGKRPDIGHARTEPAPDAWAEAAGWDAPARSRRTHALALADDDRLRLVEEMILMALRAGLLRPTV